MNSSSKINTVIIPHLMSNLYQSALISLFGLLFLCKATVGITQHQPSNQSIKIGFLIRDKNDTAIQQAADLAIAYANEEGGYNGKFFELTTKSCDGPWGIGSKQAVDLIHEDQVSLIVTALDGRNAHLAEQVTAKSHVVMLSTQSSDPTLSRAYVPWYFRMVPDDLQQAEVFVEEIYIKQKFKKVALVSLDDYDGKKSVESMAKILKEIGISTPEIFKGLDQAKQFDEFISKSWDAVVLAGSSMDFSEIIKKIYSSNYQAKIYTFLNVFNFINKPDPQLIEQVHYVKSFYVDQTWDTFMKDFQSKYGKEPSPSLAYVYDGVMLAIEAIKKFGPDSDAIRFGFNDIKYEGITGKVDFGKLGNRDFKLTTD